MKRVLRLATIHMLMSIVVKVLKGQTNDHNEAIRIVRHRDEL